MSPGSLVGFVGTLSVDSWLKSSLQWCALSGVLAMSMICRQRTRSLAFLQAEWILMFADCTSAPVPLSQVVRGRLRALLQSLGGRSDALIARCD